MAKVLKHLLCIFVIFPASFSSDSDGVYKIGVGIGDITGPPAGIVLNGHINPFTHAAGIHTRQFARAFAIESLTSDSLVVYVTCDMGMIDHSMKSEVVKKLAVKFGTKYREENILISATHTHSGVSGFMTYYAYLVIESQGFNPITYWAAVDGIVKAIEQAETSLQEGRISWNEGTLMNANNNRRRVQYENNPPEEQEKYPFQVDKEMTMLKFEDLTGNLIGVFCWFPFHPLSFNQREDNPLVSSESNGFAALALDAKFNPSGTLPGKGAFVSGFGSTNLGDVSPDNSDIIEGKSIDLEDDLRKLRNNGNKLINKALELLEDTGNFTSITGPIGSVHRYVETETISVIHFNETSQTVENLTLCKGALGFGYVGVDPEEFPFLEDIRDLLKAPSEEMVECQAPKIVALAAGEMDIPWKWAQSIVEIQVLQLGNIMMAGVPAEFTTMAGRRVKNGLFNATGDKVIVAGLSNNYINYVATPEEYMVQEYEGGATAFGKNTLPVIIELMAEMAAALKNETSDTIPIGNSPPSFLDRLPSTISPWTDPNPRNGANFGDLVVDVNTSYNLETDAEVSVIFVAGSPRNSALNGGSFLTVEKLDEATGKWIVVRSDADVDTVYYWNFVDKRAEIRWFLNKDLEKAIYRIRHFGYYKLFEDGNMKNYIGTSGQFALV